MLYLGRKKNQVIKVKHNDSGQEMTLVVLEIHGGVVKLGFENDEKTFTILRKELEQTQNGIANPNPWYKDIIPSFIKTRNEAATLRTDAAILHSQKNIQEGNQTIKEELSNVV